MLAQEMMDFLGRYTLRIRGTNEVLRKVMMTDDEGREWTWGPGRGVRFISYSSAKAMHDMHGALDDIEIVDVHTGLEAKEE